MGTAMLPFLDIPPCRGFVTRPGMTRALGGTFARADATTCATTLSQAGIFSTVAANVERSSDWLWDNGRNLGGMTLLEAACTNSALGSSDFSITTYWTRFGETSSAALSCINGQAASKETGDGSTGSPSRFQNVGTYVNGQTDVYYGIFEEGNALRSTVLSSDATFNGTAASAIYTWATGVVSTSGTPAGSGVITLRSVGPNGGRLILLWVAFTGTAGPGGAGANGNTRRIVLASVETTANSHFTYLHHGQFQAATDAPMSPIVTVASAVTRAADALDFGFAPTATQLAGTGVSIYDDFIATEVAIVTGLTGLGNNDAAAANMIGAWRKDASTWRAAVVGGAGITSFCDVTPTTAVGDRVERLVTVTTGGAVTITVSVNGGTATVGTTGAAGGWPAAFGAQRIYFVDEATAARKGGVSRRVVCILPGAVNGQPGLDRMRKLGLSGYMGDGSLLMGGRFQW